MNKFLFIQNKKRNYSLHTIPDIFVKKKHIDSLQIIFYTFLRLGKVKLR